jgi:GTP-binding protein
MRVQTSVLNELLAEAIAMVQPPTDKGRRLKIFYMTQVSTKPPTFAVFVNSKKLFHFSYERYLMNKLRQEFNFTGTPIRMLVRERKDEDDD